MHDQATLSVITGVINFLSAIGIGSFGIYTYKKHKKIDKEFALDIEWKENVDEKLEKNQKDIQDIRATLDQNKAEDMARLRVSIVRELKRCLSDGFRTQTDNEIIEPLLDIYFDDKHNGNGVVKQLAKAYHNLELKIDKDLQ